MDISKRIFLTCVLAGAFVSASATPALADVKAGVDAWSEGDFDRAVREWQPLADKGDPDAQFNLAQAYKMGRGVPTDLDKAETLYGAAARQGHVQAGDIYGLLLFQRGERAAAMPYVKAAAERGDARAQYILGVAHFNGDLVEKDWVRAYALVSLAQQAGLPQAGSALKQMDGHLPLEDRQKAVLMSVELANAAEATRARENAAASLASASQPKIASAPPAPIAGPVGAGAAFARPAVSAAPAPVSQPAKAPPPIQPKPPAKTPAAPAPAAPANAPWRIQLGAFGVAGNAQALWSKVAKRPELAGHPRLLVPAGRLTKLQAGGFASESEAGAACRKLAAAGYTCIATRD